MREERSNFSSHPSSLIPFFERSRAMRLRACLVAAVGLAAAAAAGDPRSVGAPPSLQPAVPLGTEDRSWLDALLVAQELRAPAPAHEDVARAAYFLWSKNGQRA